MGQCHICGLKAFKDWKEYYSHYTRVHQVKPVESDLNRLASDYRRDKQGKVINTSGRPKIQIVEEMETKIRNDAWFNDKLNPLIGMTDTSVEPMWNDKKELI